MADKGLRWELEKVYDQVTGTPRSTRWEDCSVPEDVCIQQDAWERATRMAVAYAAGARYEDIARKDGISAPRVRKILTEYLSEYKRHKGLPPITRYLTKQEKPVWKRPPKKFSTMVSVMATLNDGRDWLRI